MNQFNILSCAAKSGLACARPARSEKLPHRTRRPEAQHAPGAVSLLSLPVLAAFALFTLPARAMPAASMQLFRMDGRGVRAVPAISAALSSSKVALAPASASASGTSATADQAWRGEPAVQTPKPIEIAQSGSGLSDPKTLDLKPNGQIEINTQGEKLTANVDPQTLTLRFNTPIPKDIQGPITVRYITSDNKLGEIQQQISSYTISQDGTQITLKPSSNIPAGSNFAFEFPTTCSQGACVYPGQPVGQALYVGFSSSQVIGPVLAAGVAAASSFPVWAVLLGVAVVGVGVAAASGAFNGGGGSNPSSQ